MFEGQHGINRLARVVTRASEINSALPAGAPAGRPYQRRPHERCLPEHRLSDVEARRSIAISVRRAGCAVSRIAPDALDRLVDCGRARPDAIDNLCRASLYLARIDGSARLTLAHVDNVVRLRDGDSRPVRRPLVTPSDLAGPRISAARSTLVPTVGMLISAGMVIGLGAWLATGPDPGAPGPGRVRAVAAVAKPQPVTTVPAAIPVPLSASGAAREPTFAAVAARSDGAVEPALSPAGESPAADAPVSAARSSPLPACAVVPATNVAAVAGDWGVALPATAPPRVVIRYPEGDSAAWSAAQAARAALQARGVPIVAVAAAGRRVAHESVRYYYDQDRLAAEDIASRLGPPFTGPARMATLGPAEQPRAPGTIELAVPAGRATSAR